MQQQDKRTYQVLQFCPTPPPKLGCDVDEQKWPLAGGLSALTPGRQSRLAMCASDIILQE